MSKERQEARTPFWEKRLAGWKSYRLKSASEKRRWWGDFLLRNAIYILMGFLVLAVQLYSVLGTTGFSAAFLSFESILDILKKSAAALFLALGVGGIIILTGTDLSAGRIQGLSMLLAASLLQKPATEYASKMWPSLQPPPIPVVLLAVAVLGGVIGAFNGFCVSKFRLHPFIVTLATQLMLYGLILIYMSMGNNGGAPIAGLTEAYKDAVKGSVLLFGVRVPYYVFYAAATTALVWIIWNRTVFGKNMYAAGANPEAANVSGINVPLTTVLVFTMAGILYGVSGFMEAARIGSNNASAGQNAELDAIAACVIGGISFTGGVGKVSGILSGVILLQTITVALQWLGVSQNLQYIIKGIIILAAVAIDMKKNAARR